MAMTVGALARLVAGTLHGDPDVSILDAAPIESAVSQTITFLADHKKASQLTSCQASAVLVSAAVPASAFPEHLSIIVVNDPLGSLGVIAEALRPSPPRPKPGIHSSAVVDSSALLGEGVSVGPYAVIEANVEVGAGPVVHSHAVVRHGCKIGRNAEIHPHAVLYPRSEIGDRCIIHSGAIIGRDGFGFRLKDGAHHRIPQVGSVRLGADVEVGANTTIDCATFGVTSVGEGTKIDNQVMIGHNCSIGRHNILVAHVGISGSSKTGDYTVLAGKVGIADHDTIGSQVVVGAGSGVHYDLPGPAKYLTGIPCMPEQQAKRVGICVTQLPELRKRLSAVEKRLEMNSGDSETVRRAG
jgi:UDP-3-O-[3-hydroxymyristoyl] glucosamine N-acyltransferase